MTAPRATGQRKANSLDGIRTLTNGWLTLSFKWHYFRRDGNSMCGRWQRSILGKGPERRKPEPTVPEDSKLLVCESCKREVALVEMQSRPGQRLQGAQ